MTSLEINQQVLELRRGVCPHYDYCNNPYDCEDCHELNKNYVEDVAAAYELLDDMIGHPNDECEIRVLHNVQTHERLFYVDLETYDGYNQHATAETLAKSLCLVYIRWVEGILGGRIG
jgi:hypothetical protein